MRPPTTCSSGWSRNSSHVATPKLPPPPRSAPEQLGVLVGARADDAAVRRDDLGADEAVASEAVLRGRCPMPPPNVSPATPVEPTTPPGVTRPNACVAESKSSQVAPPCERAIRPSPSTSTLRISERSITSPPSQDAVAGRVVASSADGHLERVRRAKSNAVATSPAPRQRTMTAGRRSMSALKQRRAAS